MFQEYPKWIDVPGMEEGGIVVFTKEEEQAIKEQSQKHKRKQKKVENELH